MSEQDKMTEQETEVTTSGESSAGKKETGSTDQKYDTYDPGRMLSCVYRISAL